MSYLRKLRKEKGLSQQELSELLGVNQTAISQWERGITTPSSRMLLQLSQLFGVTPNQILNYDGVVYTDPEIAEAIQESLPTQISGLSDILKDCSAQEQKLTFDILVELSHVLKLEDQAHRAASISLLQNVFATSTRFMDVCANATQDIDATRIEKAQQAALAQYDQALKEALISSPV